SRRPEGDRRGQLAHRGPHAGRDPPGAGARPRHPPGRRHRGPPEREFPVVPRAWRAAGTVSQRRLLGTDGIPRLAHTAPMTPEVATRPGMAIAAQLRPAHMSVSGALRHGRVVIGKDTRLSGYLFETAIAAGIVSMGADVMLCGPLPTPGIAFIPSS